MRTGKWRNRAIAGAVVLGWHALVGWWLVHGYRVPVTGGVGQDLVVTYVQLPQRARSPQRGPRQPRRDHARSRPSRATAPMPTEPAGRTGPGRSLSVTVLDQARDYAGQVAARPLPVADPFADRIARIPATGRQRFAMARPYTPAAALAEIGKLVGGPDYEADPCPRNRRNLDSLLAAGDSQRLRMAMAFDREHCRP